LTSREPDLAAVVELMPPLLHQRRVSSDAVVQAVGLLKLEAACLAASRVRSGIASEKVAVLAEQLLGTPPKQPHELIMMENRLIDLTENDVLAACDRGLFFGGPVVAPEFTDPARPHASQAIANTRAMIEAIRAGDVSRAEQTFIKKMSDAMGSQSERAPRDGLRTA
jgi:DNA-binding GntR family transcriptional regulator